MIWRCEDCIHRDKEWYELPCDGCTMGGVTNHYVKDMSLYMNRPEETDESDS